MNEVTEFYEKNKTAEISARQGTVYLDGYDLEYTAATIDGEIVDRLTVFCEYGVTP